MSRSYGSNLPTSLTYIVLGTRGCSPWRPAADMGTVSGRGTLLPGIFKGQRKRTGRRRKRGALQEPSPYLRPNRFQGLRPLQRRENSSRGSRQRLPVRLRYRSGPPEGATSASRFRNFNPIPFQGRSGGNRFSHKPRRSVAELSCPLGPTDPCSTAVHMEPFSTSVFKVLF